ncbi:MAG: flagellar hook-associated protein FlgL [Acidobacteriota bacterium]
MRISENSMVQDFLRNLESARQRWFGWNQQVSTGKKLQKPSDNPADSAHLVRIQDDFSRTNQYLRNISTAQSKLGTASSALNALRNLTITASEKTIGALTDTTSQDSRNAIALELEGILKNIEQVAATSVDGLYIFSGSRVDTVPFTESGGNYAYQGDDHPSMIEVTQGESIQVSVPGSEVFSDSSADLLNTMRQLIDQLKAGDVASAQATLGDLQDAGKVIDAARFKISTSINQADNINNRLNDHLLDLTSEVSRLQDADMAEAISRMAQSETALNASLGAGAHMQQGSLFDYLG